MLMLLKSMLVTMHSTSKVAHVHAHAIIAFPPPSFASGCICILPPQGFIGECGLRGGFFALDGTWDSMVKAQLVKLASICLCSNVMGQLAMGCLVHPPGNGDESYETYKDERDRTLDSLRTRADRACHANRTNSPPHCRHASLPSAASPLPRPSCLMPLCCARQV